MIKYPITKISNFLRTVSNDPLPFTHYDIFFQIYESLGIHIMMSLAQSCEHVHELTLF
jgi:hypothetical protein